MKDTEILEWLEANPLAITATAVIKTGVFGRKTWWQSPYGDHDTLREAVEASVKQLKLDD